MSITRCRPVYLGILTFAFLGWGNFFLVWGDAVIGAAPSTYTPLMGASLPAAGTAPQPITDLQDLYSRAATEDHPVSYLATGAISRPPPHRPPLLPSPDPVSSLNQSPAQFTTLANDVTFIQSQRQTVTSLSGTQALGLPLTDYTPAGVTAGSAAMQDSGLYDNSLATLALIQNGNMTSAKQLLDIYASGFNGNMDLRAYPNSTNGNSVNYQPFTSSAYYEFDQTRANGIYSSDWQQYDVHTGPNAWLALAAAQYVAQAKSAGLPQSNWQPELDMATRLGDAMIDLQLASGSSSGAILYGPATDDNSKNEIDTENDLDAYSALNAIARVSGNVKYQQAASKVSNFLLTAPGLRDASTGLFHAGLTLQNGQWQPQSLLAADSGGTWAISALGPKALDVQFGAGAAYSMWMSVREQMGRTDQLSLARHGVVTMSAAGATGRLDGLDFTNAYPASEGLISPEWTAGAINALKELVTYYESPTGKGAVSAAQISQMNADIGTMQSFVAQHSTAYAVGPGLTDSRGGQTGFGTQAPPASVSAMSAMYGSLGEDPLSWGSNGP